MSRINTNVASMLAQRVLGNQRDGLNTSLERLSTGIRINRGADNPAGLIASESLRSEKAAISAAIGNAQRAEQVMNVAEGGLQEINNLLLELQSLVGESANEAGLSSQEKEANQLQIDSILDTIDRIAGATSFNGQKLLDGSFDYEVDSVGDGIDRIAINAASLSEEALTVSVDVVSSATKGTLFMSTAAITAGDATNGDGSITIEITGKNGSQQLTFADGATAADMQTAINSYSADTGVSASDLNGTLLTLSGTEYGSENFVRVRVLDGSGTADQDIAYEADDAGVVDDSTAADDLRGTGEDIAVTINGHAASTTNGLTARAVYNGFDISVSLDGDDNVNRNATSTSFQITGGGANFNLSPEVGAGKSSIGIGSATVDNLGTATESLSALRFGNSANVVDGNDLNAGQQIVDAAIKQVSALRGRLGAFQKNTLGATINNLGVALENTSAAESVIRDTDFANETANLTRQQIMSQAAMQALQIANSQPQSVLALLG